MKTRLKTEVSDQKGEDLLVHLPYYVMDTKTQTEEIKL